MIESMARIPRISTSLRQVIAVGAFVSVSMLSFASHAMAAEASAQDLSGTWELRYDSRSVPAARLTAAATAASRAMALKDIESRRWCRIGGMPFLMLESPLIDIRQSRAEIVIAPQLQAVARHLYTDGVARADLKDFDPATNGYTVAKWEGSVLVSETKGFSDLGITAIPGGGYRTENSRLVERFRLLDGGKRLSVTSTWTDPGVFAAPHSYEVRYYRSGVDTKASAQACDPFEAGREEFFAPALRPSKEITR
jgi:hypothetical protein